MSTPSTVTATLPLPHHNALYGYPNHKGYQTNGTHYGTSNTLTSGPPRLAPSYNSFPNNLSAANTRNTNASSTSRPPQPSANMATSQSTSALQGSVKRERHPDWKQFYKNGIPDEIIIIDDDSPAPPLRIEKERENYTTRTVMNGNTYEHAPKKRKIGQGPVFEPVQSQQASYSNPRTNHDHHTGSNTISRDRTTSLHTTAPTSLGSHTSHGSMGAYVDDGAVGQKRKRVTRQQTADEKKRKEIEVVGDAYSSYVPPPKPPIKAKDVHVPPVRDVECQSYLVKQYITNQILDHDESAENR